MRVLILALSVLGILVSAGAAKAGLIVATRDMSASIDPATLADESNQTTEDQIGLDKGNRRDVQRRLNGLGFHTKVTGKFDGATAPSLRDGRRHTAMPRLASSTRFSLTRY
jgi:hypothetical protein